MKKCLVLLVLVFTILSCKENAGRIEITETTSEPQAMNYDTAVSADESEANTAEKTQAKIIKTGKLRFPTKDLDESYKAVITSLKKHKGNVQSDISGKEYNSSFHRNLTIRIPNAHFDAFVSDVSKGVTYFEIKEITSTDVTEQFIDITARLKAKKVLEERYLDLLKKANKVSEMLEIEQQLSNIREEIEAKQAQLNYLQSQVSMSTISIEMYTENASGGNATISYGSKMWNAIVSGFNGISTFFIGILYLWPFILILAITIFFVRRRIRKNKKA